MTALDQPAMLAVTMAGGSDTSLWPLSRELFPK